MRNIRRVGMIFETDTIEQHDDDPSNPEENDTWVKKTGSTYQFSYQTKAGTIKRLTLSA